MHLFFETVWKLHIGEMPERPRLCDSYIGPCVKWTGGCSCEVLSKEYNAAIAAIKQNALTVGNQDLAKSVFIGEPLPDRFYPWPGSYETKETMSDGWVPSYDDPDNSGWHPPAEPITVAILTLPEEKKNIMENMTKELTDDQIYTMWVDFQWALAAPEDYMQGLEHGFCSGLRWMIKKGYVVPSKKALGIVPVVKASGSVAAPKEEGGWSYQKDIHGNAWEFFQHNDFKFKALIRLPQTLCDQLNELASLRQQLVEHKAINSLLAGDEPEVALANEVFQLRQQLKEREEALKELLPIVEKVYYGITIDDVIINEKYIALQAIIERARKLLSK